MTRHTAFALSCHTLIIVILFQNGDMYSTIYIPRTATDYDGSAYTFFTHTQTWNTARHVCASIGARLAKLDNGERLSTASYAVQNATTDTGNDIWVGLHRDANQRLTHDLDCTLLNVTVSGMDVFTDINEYNFDENSQCFKLQFSSSALKKHDCGKVKRFLCERKTGISCPFSPVSTFPTVLTLANASASSCQSICELQHACYLAGNYSTNHCVMLSTSTDSSNMMNKFCPIYVTVNNSNTDEYVGPDETNKAPGECSPLPDPEVASSVTSISFASVSTDDVIIPSSSCDVTLTMTTQSIQYVPQTVTLPVVYATVTMTTESVQYITETLSPQVNYVTVTEATTIETTNIVSASPLTFFVTLTETHVQSETITNVLNTCSAELPTTLSPSSHEQQTTSSGVISLVPSPSVSGHGMQQTEVCKTFNLTTLHEASLEQIAESISSRLIVETTNLSRTIRQKTSAPDPRRSSKGMGYVAISVVCVPLFLALLIDIPLVLQHVQGAFVNIQTEGTLVKRRRDPRKI